MPLQATSGAASYDAFGGGMAVPNYIEEVFSTWLYTGNGSTQTITNGIDLAGKGGLVWGKTRGVSGDHVLADTVRGRTKFLASNLTDAETESTNQITSFDSSGITLGSGNMLNQSSRTFALWTFREQPKFFDVVTYTGNGQNNRQIAHNLGSVPGCIMVKRTNAAADWYVYHRGLNGGVNPQNHFILLNSTAAQGTYEVWENTAPTSTVFTVDEFSSVNGSGDTFVAYLFAHNAGGFGLTGTDNVISCGSFTPDALGNATVNLGYEPQWILYKGVSGAGGTDSWVILDTMRGWDLTASDRRLFPNTSGAENTSSAGFPTATGFQVENLSNSPYIYIAIRRGPMKVPTTGTSVLGLNARAGTGANATVTGGAGVTDLAIIKRRNSTPVWAWASRLTGTGYLSSNATTAETAAGTTMLQANPWDVMDGVKVGTTSDLTNASSGTFINYLIDRAPGFMDVCCYTGTGVARTVAHNLTVVPEMMIVKNRTTAVNWNVYHAALGNTQGIVLNGNIASAADPGFWNDTSPTASIFTVGTNGRVNANNDTYVAYLFASCPGVSKVGSYTGTGTTQVINCGFTAGSRFVLIKRTDSTGDWYVWDSARGIVAGNDPYLLLNSTAAEVTNTDFIDTAATGFEISSTAPAAINASGGTFIFLAIA